MRRESIFLKNWPLWSGVLLLALLAIKPLQHTFQKKTLAAPLTAVTSARDCFDAAYYKKTYLSLKKNKIDPFLHYFVHGYKKFYNPSSDFDAAFYERMYLACPEGYPKRVQQNPLVHYVKKGKAAGCLTHPKFIKKVIPLQKAQHYICLTAIFRDEARFLKEWIEHYRMMGVEHFYLTNHLSKDHFMDVLQPYIDAGIVTLRHDFEEPTKEHKTWKAIQNRAYKWAIEETRFKTEWLLIVDTDEFVLPYQNKNLVQFLKNYDDCAAVAIHWKTFGTGGVAEVKEGELLTEKLSKCVKDGYNDEKVIQSFKHTSAKTYVRNIGVKSVIKPRYTQGMPDCHFATLKPGYVAFNTKKEPVPLCYGYVNICDTGARIHHYVMRDLKFFKERKLPRHSRYANWQGAFTRSLLQLDKVLSSSKNDTMSRLAPELKRRVAAKTVVF